MSLFDRLVDEALRNRSDLAVLRPVVEKELLHHDILREMSEARLLGSLTFIGGTCLRACYGSERLSEDLDFTGGPDFDEEMLAELGKILVDRIQSRYDLPVTVTEPRKTGRKVSTWKMAVETRPGKPHLPRQRIHIDICAIPSHDPRPMMLRNIYGVDVGTSGLILQAQSREEILADKLIAFAFRENRIKNRDLWDISWLVQQGVQLPVDLIPLKLADHLRSGKEFIERAEARCHGLTTDSRLRDDFIREMQRFLPASLQQTVGTREFWRYLASVVEDQVGKAARPLK